VLNFLYSCVQENLDACVATLGFEHVGDVLRGAVAEKLAESFLVIRNAMPFYQRNKIRRRVAGQRGFGEVFVGAEKIIGAAMDVREIAAAAAGDEDFLADAVSAFEDGDAASSFSGLGRAEEAGGASAEDQSVKFVGWLRQAAARLGLAKCACVRSSG
jgi:hypothetical protein